MFYLKFIKIILMLFLTTSSFSFDISRTDFDRRMDTGGGYREVEFTNHSEKPVRYKFSAITNDKEKDMSKWVELYPKVMTIPPLEKRTLKIYAKSPKDKPWGEYSFYLNIDTLVVPTIKATSKGKIVGTTSVSFVPRITMYGYIGETNYEKNIKFENIKFETENKKQFILGNIINDGDIGANLVLRFMGGNEFVLNEKWLGRIGKNSNQNIKIELDGFKIKDIKELKIYDANSPNRKIIKTIKL